MLLEAIDGTKLTTDKPAPQVQALIKTLRAQIKVFHQQTLQAPEKSSNWREQVTAFQDHEWAAIHQSMADLVETGALSVPSLPGILRWVERIDEHLLNLQLQIDALLPWWRLLAQPPALLQNESGNPALAAAWQDLEPILITIPPLARLAETAQAGLEKLTALQEILSQSASTEADWLTANAWAAQLQSSLETGLDEGPRLLQELQTLETTLENTVQAMDFTFLYNPKQKVFHLGYDLASDQLDSNHYDLLASEARTASLIAIAKGDVPAEHWLHLNRPIVALDHTRTLLSWNGSMFEYLMPDLMIRTYPGSLQYQTNRAVVRRQIEYAGQQGAPWGISEAGYYNFDNQQNYQYRGFGVPGLGRKRNLAKDLVIAPYASLLALHINPQAVMQNLEHLQAEQALGPFGYYESIDYTPARLPLNQKRAIVRSYMAHHQGMILNSVCNALCDDVLVRYFHLDPRAESVELLLQERFPPQAPVEQTPREFEQTALERAGSARPSSLRSPLALKAWPIPQNPPWPQAQYLSNGSYSVLITESGGGFSRYRDERGESEQNVALTRWRADATLDDWGSWLYVQDEERDQTFSVGAQPLPGESKPGQYQVKFSPHKAEFQRREGDLSISLEVGVAPNDPLEIRRVTVRNQSAQTRRVSLTSYGEVVLSSQAADQQHPAFNKLFVESQYLPEEGLLLFSRRARSPEEMPLVLAHCVVLPNSQAGDSSYETDRAKFLGRGQNARSAAALQKALSHTPQEAAAGPIASLDPIFAIRQEVEVRPYQSVQLAYLTLCAPSTAEAIAIARRYRTLAAIEQAFRQTQRQQEAELAEAGLSAAQLQHYQQLLSGLVYPNPALRAAPERLAANQQGQPSLWRFGISGDEAILLVKINDLAEIGLVHESLAAHRFWRRRQFPFDLVILNQKDRGYAQDLHEQIQRLVTQLESDHWLNRRGGIFLLRASDLPEQTPLLLESAARIVLDGQRGPLGEQLQPLLHAPTYLPRIMASRARAEASSLRAVPRPANLQFDNGLGGFSPDGKEYQIYLEEGRWTPMAWSNVIANPNFGFLTSEAGFGFTWAGNSGENRLTPWHNDPLQDRPGEALYLRDEETLRVWSPTPLPARSPEPYLIRHGAGYSIYQHHSQGLIQSVKVFAAPDAPLKMVVLQLENPGKRGRRITATYYVEWVLDAQRATAQQFILPEYEPASGALLAANPYNPQFQKNVAFLAGSQNPHGLTTDRREFLGRLGDLSHPAALTRVGLSSKVEAGLDPCAALQLHIDLAAGETKQVFFLLGQGRDKADALDLIQQYRSEERVAAVWQASQSSWEALLGQVQVKTPEPALDILLNHWLLYQNLSCRIWGRSAAYQSSGAYGFRDQLQDVLALIDTQPSLVREQILRAARHQFEAGDVLHWWHPPFGRGVRTRVSDDLLWLPYVTAAYLRITHDFEILNESLPFLVGAPLSPTEHERYDLYASTPESFSLYEHCRRAIARGSTQGAHGLPLIGGGDWNDGMNRVGIEGYGESVWLGWFLYTVLEGFAPLSEQIGDAEQAESYRQRAKQLQENLHSHAWDGAWYRRAYFDDGSPLGSTQNSECQIDSIAQSWAVISGAGESERNVQAMQAVYERLVEQEARLLPLFRPPFDETEHDPGYIKGYPAGIRENGGQYTHGALWTVWAVAQMGNGERAAELYRLLNPILHADTPEKAARYAVEPYVIAADVYSAPGLVGRGGWTWYTGSAGWAYRVGLEMMLGLRRQAQQLTINPCIPPTWKSFHIDYRYQKSVYQIQVENPQAVAQGIASVALDGQICPDGIIPLRDDGQEHHVLVTMGTETD
ncbi:MAG: glucoamylase family protein [Anaerolineales bacterium]|jgi:cyclic beta-1,2-glucan synthetase|nr:glucoamylase family protein [Anaerolineales bacterium]